MSRMLANIPGIFWTDSELEGQLSLNGILTLVDLQNFSRNLESIPLETRSQVAYADRILLNKRDLVNDQEYTLTVAMVTQLNPLANVFTCTFGQVDFDFVFGIESLDKQRLISLLAAQDSLEHRHALDISTISLRNDSKPLDLVKFREFIGTLLWEPLPGLEIFRIKGLLWVKDSHLVHVIQAVHKTMDIEDYTTWKESGNPQMTKVVLIGKGVEEHVEDLQRGFSRCFQS